MEKIILISGKAEHGKDLAAQIIKNKLVERGNRVVISYNAKYIKLMAKDYCGWNGEKEEESRTLLQLLGKEMSKDLFNDPNFHTRRLCEDIQICKEYFDYVIIPDCRFPEDILYPKIIFGNQVLDIRINRPNFESSLTQEQKNHSSEIALDKFQFTVSIDAPTKETLQKSLEECMISQGFVN